MSTSMFRLTKNKKCRNNVFFKHAYAQHAGNYFRPRINNINMNIFIYQAHGTIACSYIACVIVITSR